MPRININENENVVLSIANPTANTVLIPLLCEADSESSKKAQYFANTETTKFKSAFESRIVENETSYAYALTLMNLGLNVIIKPIISNADYSEDEITQEINLQINDGEFDEFMDKNLFNIKFITTGAHANIISEGSAGLGGCFSKLAAIAAKRGDAIALVDVESNITMKGDNGTTSIIELLGGSAEGDNMDFAACFFPWGTYSTTKGTYKMPGSFGYLSALAASIQVNADWYAVAGVSRGAIPNLLSTECEIGESDMHILLNEETTSQLKINVNPIMQVGEYGTKIWGNKVAHPFQATEAYRSYLNIRMLLCDINKQIYASATRVTFEPNDMITWLSFKKLNNELLDTMVANRGIEWYTWRRVATTKKATINAVLTIKPIEAVEYFEIAVNLSQDEVETEEI